MRPLAKLGLGWQTDLIFARFDAQVIERADCLVVRTAHNPTFWWGNFLLFDHVPAEAEATGWLDTFDREISRVQPESRHVAMGIDAADPFEMPSAFLEAGLTRYAGEVLTMARGGLLPAMRAPSRQIRVSPLDLNVYRDELLDLQVASDNGYSGSPEGYRVFRERQLARYAAMERAGMGHWFGAFVTTDDGERLVADCGLFHDAVGAAPLGRFQQVATHPEWRRQGICGALIREVCRHGFDAMDLAALVIIADPDDIAIGIYESAGFRRTETRWQLERKPDEAAASGPPAPDTTAP